MSPPTSWCAGDKDSAAPGVERQVASAQPPGFSPPFSCCQPADTSSCSALGHPHTPVKMRLSTTTKGSRNELGKRKVTSCTASTASGPLCYPSSAQATCSCATAAPRMYAGTEHCPFVRGPRPICVQIGNVWFGDRQFRLTRAFLKRCLHNEPSHCRPNHCRRLEAEYTSLDSTASCWG